jgi:Rrf2 family iron-sulfur cluster assembly transcriptional regulator
MLISTMCRYGVRALSDLACYGEGEPMQIKDISKRQHIPPRYLEQIFHRLLKAGFITSKRGPRGGYLLKRPASEITVLDVIEKIQGPVEFADCKLRRGAGKKCNMMSDCITMGVWNEARDRVREYFDSVTIDTLCEQEKQRKQAEGA